MREIFFGEPAAPASASLNVKSSRQIRADLFTVENEDRDCCDDADGDAGKAEVDELRKAGQVKDQRNNAEDRVSQHAAEVITGRQVQHLAQNAEGKDGDHAGAGNDEIDRPTVPGGQGIPDAGEDADPDDLIDDAARNAGAAANGRDQEYPEADRAEHNIMAPQPALRNHEIDGNRNDGAGNRAGEQQLEQENELIVYRFDFGERALALAFERGLTERTGFAVCADRKLAIIAVLDCFFLL